MIGSILTGVGVALTVGGYIIDDVKQKKEIEEEVRKQLEERDTKNDEKESK